MASTGLMPGSSSSALSWAGSTEDSGLLFKAMVNGKYANDHLPEERQGRACCWQACLPPLWACHMKGFVFLPLAPAWPGWGCSHQKTKKQNKTKISFRPKQNEALAGLGGLLDVLAEPPRAPSFGFSLNQPYFQRVL